MHVKPTTAILVSGDYFAVLYTPATALLSLPTGCLALH